MVEREKNTATSTEIAEWMLRQFEAIGWLRQSNVAVQILTKFGDKYVYRNKNRNYAINKDILDEFRRITPDNVVWSRSRQQWRRRRAGDPPGRMVR
jgi:ribosomal protein S19E (S16A)